MAWGAMQRTQKGPVLGWKQEPGFSHFEDKLDCSSSIRSGLFRVVRILHNLPAESNEFIKPHFAARLVIDNA
jgi:hypothetical protein